MRSLAVRGLAVWASACLAAWPPAAALADAMQDAAREAQSAGQAQIDQFAMPDLEGDTVHFGQESIDLHALFPDDPNNQTLSDFTDLYDDSTRLDQATTDRQNQLDTENSAAGEAYRTVRNSLYRSHPDLSDDPMWTATDAIIDFTDLKKANCAGTGSRHTPDYQTCQRPTEHPKYCVGDRQLHLAQYSADVFLGVHGVDVNTFRFDLKDGAWSLVDPSDGNQPVAIIPTFDFDEFCGPGKSVRIELAGATDWPNAPTAGDFDHSYTFRTLQMPSCGNGLVGVAQIDDLTGKQWFKYGVHLILHFHVLDQDAWLWSRPDCPDDIARVQSGSCSGTVQCTQNADNCVTLEGIKFCAGDLNPPPGGVPAGCTRISVNKTCGAAGSQPDQCLALEQTPSCGFISSRCVQTDPQTGQCQVTEDTYDCGYAPGDDAACLAANHLGDLVQDCNVTEVVKETTRTVHNPVEKSCVYLNTLSSCRIQRDLDLQARQSSQRFDRGCFGSEQIAFTPDWAGTATLEATASLSWTGENTNASIVQQPGEANGWTTIVQLTGPGEANCPAGTGLSGSIGVRGVNVLNSEIHNPADAGNRPCVKDSDDWVKTDWTCEAAYAPVVDGRTIPRRALPALYPGETGDPACMEASAAYTPKTYNQGALACWTDAGGVEHCPENTAADALTPPANNCGALESDPQCALSQTRCVEGSQGPGGFCFVEEHVYDCGTDVTVTVQDTDPVYDCPTPIRCMGEECIAHPEETNSDFGQAAAMLQVAQFAGMDMRCGANDTPDLCRVFSGEDKSCKKAVGGWVDCCETPAGISIADYITLAFNIAELDSAIMRLGDTGVGAIEGLRGGWETLRAPVADTWSAVTQPFTDSLANIAGQVSPAASDVVKEGVIDTFKQTLMRQVAEWTGQTFGAEAGNLLFSVVPESGGSASAAFIAGENGAVKLADGSVQLGGGAAVVGTALNVVMIAYTTYAILNILVNIIWECEEDEFELGARRALRSCHYVGAYCKGFGCIEEQRVYCCFSSPLSRIIQEQVRPQLGRDWGTAQRPDCSGFAISEMSHIDWNQVNLDEWVDILAISGQWPDANALTLDNLTGSGSALNAGGSRVDAAERTRLRSEGLDASGVRRNVEQELYP